MERVNLGEEQDAGDKQRGAQRVERPAPRAARVRGPDHQARSQEEEAEVVENIPAVLEVAPDVTPQLARLSVHPGLKITKSSVGGKGVSADRTAWALQIDWYYPLWGRCLFGDLPLVGRFLPFVERSNVMKHLVESPEGVNLRVRPSCPRAFLLTVPPESLLVGLAHGVYGERDVSVYSIRGGGVTMLPPGSISPRGMYSDEGPKNIPSSSW